MFPLSMKQINAMIGFIGILLLPFYLYGQNGDLKIGKTYIIKSETLKEKREIIISLPAGYDTLKTKLPVIYILDGEYRFKPSFGIYSYITYWKGVPNAILVGINNISRETRVRDYLPSSYRGSADNFLIFIEQELIPFITENFKASDNRYLAGHSHGGIFTMYTFLKSPKLFSGYIACDPSLSGLNNFATENLKESYDSIKFYLCSSDIGANVAENTKQAHMNGFNRFKELFESRDISGLDLKINHIKDDHANSYVQGFSEGLRHVLGRK